MCKLVHFSRDAFTFDCASDGVHVNTNVRRSPPLPGLFGTGPITGSPSAHGRWPQSSPRPRRGWPRIVTPVDLERDPTDVKAGSGLCASLSARCRRSGGDHSGHELNFGPLAASGISQLPAPAKYLLWQQSMTPRTAQTESPTVSATIRALSSSLQRRRRPLPVNTSSRRAGSVIALCSLSILSLTIQNGPQTWQIKPSAERWDRSDAYQHCVGTGFAQFIAWLNRCRRLSKDWECLNRKALAFLRLASIRLMLRKLCNPARVVSLTNLYSDADCHPAGETIGKIAKRSFSEDGLALTGFVIEESD
jgi:hypothetical protein